MKVYDHTYVYRDITRRENHGMPWGQLELQQLRRLFLQGTTDLKTLCNTLQRPASGIVPKLVHLGLINRPLDSVQYYFTDPNSTQHKEPTMSDKIIETKTFIQGEDAANLTDAQIFQKIAKLEGQIETLNKIVTKPKKLVQAIADLHADIDKLVAYVDAR